MTEPEFRAVLKPVMTADVADVVVVPEREPHDAPVGDVMISGGRSRHIKAPHELLQLLLVGGGLHLLKLNN